MWGKKLSKKNTLWNNYFKWFIEREKSQWEKFKLLMGLLCLLHLL